MEALAVTFIKARHIKLVHSLTIENFYDVENHLLLLNNGQIIYTQDGQQYTVSAGEILFIPSGRALTITYGGGSNPITLHNYYLNLANWQYFHVMQGPTFTANFENFSYITFDAKFFDAINFFSFMGIPAFVIKDNEPLSTTLKNILIESSAVALGRERMIKAHTEQLIVQIIRHLFTKNLFIEKLSTIKTYFEDPRLVSIFHYIKNNLCGDLSNRVLANIAHVSQDYVGQYFKMLTGISIQDYIEDQRMEHAVKLLRTTQKSIRDISKEVGFKDTGYFCRRFKMKFGISTRKIRAWEAHMSMNS